MADAEATPIRFLNEEEPPSWWPLAETMVERGPLPIATFASQFSSPSDFTAAAADVEFLETLDVSRVMPGGAADFDTLKLLVKPDAQNAADYAAGSMPTPASLVADFRPTDFRSAIRDLHARPPLPYLGYLRFSCCDEIHTDDDKQYIFSTEADLEDDDGDDDDEGLRETLASCLEAHAELKQYVLNNQLFYLLFHTDRRQFAIENGELQDGEEDFPEGYQDELGDEEDEEGEEMSDEGADIDEENVEEWDADATSAPCADNDDAVSGTAPTTDEEDEAPVEEGEVVDLAEEGDMASIVILLAVGVSPSTGNLVGVVSSQVCHNLCD